MNLVLMTQYFDTLKEIGASSRTNTILIPHSPGSLANLSEQIRNAMIEAGQTVEPSRFKSDHEFAGSGNVAEDANV
jgi:ABC-type dipeptide/oligopeptide/nickel transport system ATPase component